MTDQTQEQVPAPAELSFQVTVFRRPPGDGGWMQTTSAEGTSAAATAFIQAELAAAAAEGLNEAGAPVSVAPVATSSPLPRSRRAAQAGGDGQAAAQLGNS